MISGINHSLGNIQYPPLQQDDAGPQRRKRSIDTTQVQLNTTGLDGMEASDHSKKRSGGLDSLGRGNIL
ncbi:hypothetical protein [Pseudomonas sp. R5-89-07]|uniref:hypothetical protein n=1 Tax=Pseudomonas sp. R5-89-07 TaxID=658644 RepID=UPI000F56623C|nr:hypothetical protein [Pseudomonas sp. R5-89-07]AZF07256.1 hypothetical protein C4J94_4519 [Pseudomonas sp. R5-89-07]